MRTKTKKPEGKRIIDKNVDLPTSLVQEFFSNRSKGFKQENPYISVLYQDENPELALARDKVEKNKILPLLNLTGKENILDIGCGVGRWADALTNHNGNYVGIDFCGDLIKNANERIRKPRTHFYQLAAENVHNEKLEYYAPFNIVIISGVLLYMNDSKVIECFKGCQQLLSNNSFFYIREPLAIQKRLTLNGVWSEDLKQKYYSIYRTASELSELIIKGLGFSKDKDFKFKAIFETPTLNNRKETQQFYTFFKWCSKI